MRSFTVHAVDRRLIPHIEEGALRAAPKSLKFPLGRSSEKLYTKGKRKRRRGRSRNFPRLARSFSRHPFVIHESGGYVGAAVFEHVGSKTLRPSNHPGCVQIQKKARRSEMENDVNHHITTRATSCSLSLTDWVGCSRRSLSVTAGENINENLTPSAPPFAPSPSFVRADGGTPTTTEEIRPGRR